MEFQPASMKSLLARVRSIKLFALVLGAGAGFAYYHYVGCVSGTCPISSNPWISTGYGAFLGWLIVPAKPKAASPSNTDKKEG